MRTFRAIIGSMTSRELFYPHILTASRKRRIAGGAGVGVDQINNLLRRFEDMQQYAKLLTKSGPFKNIFR